MPRKRTEKYKLIHPAIQLENQARFDSKGEQPLNQKAILELYLNAKIGEWEDTIEVMEKIKHGEILKVER
jgi:hypothetical protein